MLITLGNPVARSWFLESFPPSEHAQESLSTMGSGPYPEADLVRFMLEGEILVVGINENTGTLIVGRDDYDTDVLDSLINQRAGQELRVYSQEMFLLYWMSGCDPFDDPDIARALGEGHPVLEYLNSIGFEWPRLIVSRPRGSGIWVDPDELGLSDLGYRTGRQFRSARARHARLTEIFEMPLRSIQSKGGSKEWGAPRSSDRLRTIAYKLKKLHNGRIIQERLAFSCSHYRQDLDWLQATYWEPRLGFIWPKAYVPPRMRR